VQVGRELSVPQNSSPFATVDGWRLNSAPALSVLFHLEGQTCQVNLRSDARQLSAGFGGDHAVLARDLIHAHQTEIGWTFLIGQGSADRGENDIAATVFVDEGAILVERGEVWTYPFLRPDIAADTLEASDDVKAPLPGKIALVQPGLHVGLAVRKGDVLVVLEAMKMEHALTAPRDGVVADLNAVAGRQVRAGDLLVRLVEEDPA
jgi:3-methylcrotonyl-CoA carboxylase alpha subunit